jgi:hypothetical protein
MQPSGRKYWHNPSTLESTWNPPGAFTANWNPPPDYFASLSLSLLFCFVLFCFVLFLNNTLILPR